MAERKFPESGIERKFSSPEEELEFLRKRVERRERELLSRNERPAVEALIREDVSKYRHESPERILSPQFVLTSADVEAIKLDLSPEEHDVAVSRFVSLIHEKGIRNTFSVLEKMANPHIEDDLERYLVQYVKAGYGVKGLRERNPVYQAIHSTLYEITLPELTGSDREKNLRELVSPMEQLYLGMLAAPTRGKTSSLFSIELSVANHSDEFVFYAAVPDERRELFEKQALSLFPNAKVAEKKDDYNIFNEAGGSVGSLARLEKNSIFPLKTYDSFDYDPLNVILNSFSKIERDGEGAAIQLLMMPTGDIYTSRYRGALERVMKGVSVKEAVRIHESFGGYFGGALREILTGQAKKPKETEQPHIDEIAVESIKAKIATPIVLVNIRIIASAGSEERASSILSAIESAFNQFENAVGNRLVFERLRRRKLKKLFHDFSFRLWGEDFKLPLSIRELASVMHLPSTRIDSAYQLKRVKAGVAPPPPEVPHDGTFIAVSRSRNEERKIYLAEEDRLRHFYCLGQTGTGKTTLLKTMVAQDIERGEGLCMIDPHGTDIDDVLTVVPKERYEDVIYFDPAFTERPMALNMLEFDRAHPEQKTFVVNEMLSIFDKLFDMKTVGGPMFEQYFRNAVLLVLEDPEAQATLLDVSRVLASKEYRQQKLLRCGNPIVVGFWREIAERAGGEAALQNIVPYITSKFDAFLSNDFMRPIIAQEKSSWNFREVMDSRKILLVNLSKGRLGDLNAYLIGLILVGKILMATLSRVDTESSQLPIFYLYIDEFQNVTTPSIVTILSEARKYKLSLHIAHQFIAQLDEKIRDAVFGNVGSIVSFRVGPEDAEFLEKQFAPVFRAEDLINLDNRHAYVRLLVHGRPVRPFSVETVPPPVGNRSQIPMLKEMSYLKYGRPRTEIEASIAAFYKHNG